MNKKKLSAEIAEGGEFILARPRAKLLELAALLTLLASLVKEASVGRRAQS